MVQPLWSGKHPDYIVIKSAPNVVEVGGLEGEWIDRRTTPYLEIAVEMNGCKLSPTSEFEVSDQGVAEIWLLERAD